MTAFVDFPFEIAQSILEIICEDELFEQVKGDPSPFRCLKNLSRTTSPISPRRRLKPFAFHIASRVCRSWRDIVQASSTFWVANHPPVTHDTSSLSSEQDCDLDVYQAYPGHNQPQMNTREQFEKYLFPLLPRVRVLVLLMKNSAIAEIVMNHLAQAYLPRLRVVHLSCATGGWIPQIAINAPSLYHLNLSHICSFSGVAHYQTKGQGLLSLACLFPRFIPNHLHSALNMDLLSSNLRPSSKTLTLLRISLDKIDLSSMDPETDVIPLPSLVEVYFCCPIPCLLRCMELFKAPKLHTFRVDTASLTFSWHCDPEFDGLDILKLSLSSGHSKAHKFVMPALKELSVCARAEAFPYLFSLLSEEDLSSVEHLSLKICSCRIEPSQLELIPFKDEDKVHFPRLRKLELWAEINSAPSSSKIVQINLCLSIFNFSSVTDEVSITSYGDWESEFVLNFLPLKTFHAGRIVDLSHVIAPSIHHVELTDMRIHPRDFEYLDALPSRNALSQAESLRLKQVTNIIDLFADEEIYGFFPGIRILILDLDLETRHFANLNPLSLPVSIPLRFTSLETLKLIAHSVDHVNVKPSLQKIVEEVSCFNQHGQQTIRRIELHGWGYFLDAAVPLIRKSLSPGVEFCSVETVTPTVTRKFGWN